MIKANGGRKDGIKVKAKSNKFGYRCSCGTGISINIDKGSFDCPKCNKSSDEFMKACSKCNTTFFTKTEQTMCTTCVKTEYKKTCTTICNVCRTMRQPNNLNERKVCTQCVNRYSNISCKRCNEKFDAPVPSFYGIQTKETSFCPRCLSQCQLCDQSGHLKKNYPNAICSKCTVFKRQLADPSLHSNIEPGKITDKRVKVSYRAIQTTHDGDCSDPGTEEEDETIEEFEYPLLSIFTTDDIVRVLDVANVVHNAIDTTNPYVAYYQRDMEPCCGGSGYCGTGIKYELLFIEIL
jgi:hypothetical protein